MALKTLEDLLKHTMKDILYAEKQIEKELPKMARKASSEQLRIAFEQHVEETRQQIENLEQAFAELDVAARGEKCEAILGILEEAKTVMDEIEDPDTLDAGMIASAQAVEHYEISRYGTIIAWAEQLGHGKIADLARKNLEQEISADQKLSAIAEAAANPKAA